MLGLTHSLSLKSSESLEGSMDANCSWDVLQAVSVMILAAVGVLRTHGFRRCARQLAT
jgi:hypothetical protein